jgi:acetolactate decarboxylase
MKKDWMMLGVFAVLGLVVIATSFNYASWEQPASSGMPGASDPNDALYQAGSLQALQESELGGMVTVGDGLSHGGFGIGTFTGLNGEMIVLDSVCYQVTDDGVVHIPSSSEGTPFMQVSNYSPGRSLTQSQSMNMSLESSFLNWEIDPDSFCLILVHGTFLNMKVRSVPGQVEPYPPLQDVVANQSIYNYTNVTGTMVVIYTPNYTGTVSVIGYHWHFISDDRRKGGHVLDFMTDQVTVGIDEKSEMRLVKPMLPQGA